MDLNPILHGIEAFYATPFGAGVGFITALWLLVDLVKKAK